MSYLLGEAKTVDDAADTLMATVFKDKEAMARLVAKRKDLAFVMDKIKDTSTTELNMLDNIPTNGIVDDLNKLDSADALVQTLDEDVYFRYLTTLNDKGADLTKRTFGASPFEKMAINRAERRAAGIRGKVDDIDILFFEAKHPKILDRSLSFDDKFIPLSSIQLTHLSSFFN